VRVLALEPYYGGSHRAFLDGYREHSRHDVELLTLPAHKWKWRMRGAALTFARQLEGRGGDFDVVFASDFLDLAALIALWRDLPRDVARVAYFHENQVTYPVRDEAERDYQFGFTNITTCLAADLVLFNSRYHLGDFLCGVERLLGKMPDRVPEAVPDRIRRRARVVPVGVDLSDLDAARASAAPRHGPLSVLWNHRWEYDKGADLFLGLMMELADEGRAFDLAVAGQAFRRVPEVFGQARGHLAPRLRSFGYVPSRADYCRLLVESDVVVSTADQEFFGMSVVEAAYAGCMPLLPHRLSYPELLPQSVHPKCLYDDRVDLKARLVRLMEHPDEARSFDLGAQMKRFGWDAVAPQLDEALAGAVRR